MAVEAHLPGWQGDLYDRPLALRFRRRLRPERRFEHLAALRAQIAAGAALNPPDPATFYSPGPAGYTDYPALGA